MTLLERICLASGRKVEVLRRQKRKKPPNKMVRSVDDQGNSIVKIRMSNNHDKWAVVDIRYAGMLSVGTWSCTPKGYVLWSLRQGLETLRIFLHSVIYGAKKGQLIDHWNHDTFDNRRKNLRLADKSKNGHNKLKYLRNGKSTSKFKGVRLHWRDKKWYTYIVLPNNNRKQTHLGIFKTQIDAARAYDKAAKKHFGKFALLNGV